MSQGYRGVWSGVSQGYRGIWSGMSQGYRGVWSGVVCHKAIEGYGAVLHVFPFTRRL